MSDKKLKRIKKREKFWIADLRKLAEYLMAYGDKVNNTVLGHIILNLNNSTNLFESTQAEIAELCDVSTKTVERTIKAMRNVTVYWDEVLGCQPLIKKEKQVRYMMNPLVMFVGLPSKRSELNGVL